MGYYFTRRGTMKLIPDNSSDELWLLGSIGLDDMMQRIRDHFGGDVNLSDFMISSENIRTACPGNDRYDPSDYTNYLLIQRIRTE